MTGFGLEKEEEVGILLDFSVIGEMAFFWVNVFEVSFDLVLLKILISDDCGWTGQRWETDFVEGHTVLNQQGYPGIKETDVTFEHEVLFGLGRNASLEIPQTLLGWEKKDCVRVCGKHQKSADLWPTHRRRPHPAQRPC